MTTPTKPPEFICPEGFQVCMSGNREYLAAELCGHLDDGEYFLIRRKPIEPDGRAMDSKPTKEGSIPSACDSCEYLTDEFLKEYSERCIYFNRRINQINQQIDELKARPSEATDNEWKLQVVNDINKLIGQRCELSDTVNRLQQRVASLEKNVADHERAIGYLQDKAKSLQDTIVDHEHALHCAKEATSNNAEETNQRLTAIESKPRQVSEGNAVILEMLISARAQLGLKHYPYALDYIQEAIHKLESAK